MRVNYLDRMEVSASALAAYRKRMDAIAENLAHAQTTRTAQGGPYRRKEVLFESVDAGAAGVADQSAGASAPARTDSAHLAGGLTGRGERHAGAGEVRASVVEDTSPFTEVYDPGHPDAGSDGVVRYPNVNPVTEMVNLVLAARAYEANVAALRSEKRMQDLALSIGRA
ncbi:MAG: flagellar basal body rod protein FlgC [Candidatus Eisenbacteria bacterium]